jgi:hypothetical protein
VCTLISGVKFMLGIMEATLNEGCQHSLHAVMYRMVAKASKEGQKEGIQTA